MTAVRIENLGDVEILTNSVQVNGVGQGIAFRVSVPVPIPSANKTAILESLALYLTDNNVSGSLAAPYPAALIGENPPLSLLFLVPQSVPPTAFNSVAPPALEDYSSGPNFVLQDLGTAVQIKQMRSNSGAGTSLAIWVLDTERPVFIPQGYQAVIWIQEPADLSPHAMTATVYAQIRWLEDDCGANS